MKVRWARLRPDGRTAITAALVLATLGIAVAGYFAQAYQYNTLFALYQQQNQQLLDNGIEPQTPQPSQIVQQGAAGADGPQGPRGIPGEDSQVPGPTGPPGSAGTNGADGSDGADSTVPGPQGEPGTPGSNGVDGQPPTSWTYTDAVGIRYTCNRTDPFDPSAPTYSCAPTP